MLFQFGSQFEMKQIFHFFLVLCVKRVLLTLQHQAF